jgi:hypothetical protein
MLSTPGVKLKTMYSNHYLHWEFDLHDHSTNQTLKMQLHTSKICEYLLTQTFYSLTNHIYSIYLYAKISKLLEVIKKCPPVQCTLYKVYAFYLWHVLTNSLFDRQAVVMKKVKSCYYQVKGSSQVLYLTNLIYLVTLTLSTSSSSRGVIKHDIESLKAETAQAWSSQTNFA